MSATSPGAKFAELYDGVAGSLVTWIRLRLAGASRSDVEPEEIVQEVWCRALDRFPSFDPARAAFRTWVFGIATNVMIETLRRRARGPFRGRAPFPSSQVVDQATSISRRVMRDETLGAFARVARALPEDERWLLIYRGLEGLSHDIVAERLGLSRDVVMKRWQRLQTRLEGAALPPDLLVE